MRKWLATAVAVPALMAVSIPLLLVAEPTLAEQATACASPPAVPAGNFTAEQVAIARAAARVADRRKLPSRAKLVILATGFQESGIRNLTYGDRDSIGWLQQRPSQGWGTVAQIMDPAYGAGKFYSDKVTQARDLTAKIANEDRDEDREGVSGFDSRATRARQFAGEMGIQAATLLAAAEGALDAYEHLTGETWKPYDTRRPDNTRTVSRRAAAEEMDAFNK